jgi:hypothetical protein
MTTFIVSEQGPTDSKLTDNILFKSSSDFSYFIESTAVKSKITCTDCILEYCDSRDIEPDSIAKFVTESLKGKLLQEMIDSGLLPEKNTLEGF